MRRARNWKHNTKDPKRYGKRNTEKYDTPFMKLDEETFLRESEVICLQK